MILYKKKSCIAISVIYIDHFCQFSLRSQCCHSLVNIGLDPVTADMGHFNEMNLRYQKSELPHLA